MGVNHDQFSHFSRLRPGSPAAILQMVLLLAQIVTLVASGLHISQSSRGQCRQLVFVVESWCCRFDRMGANHDQFSHFSHLLPCSSSSVLQMVVIWAKTVTFVTSGAKIGLSSRG